VTALLARNRSSGTAALVAAALLIAGATPVQAADVPPTLQALADTYRCDIIDRLTRIADGDSSTSRNRYILLFPVSRPGAYVQCIFVESDTEILCEAASGAYGPRRPDGTPDPPPGDRARLAALGYASPPDKNFQRRLPLGTEPDFGRVADLILRTLHDGFRVRRFEELVIRAPHARERRSSPAACDAPATS
jgi:hypothetical protein